MYDVIKHNADLLIEALQKFGITNQKRKADEELNELALEIKRDLDGRMHNVEEEMADVYIMLAQMRLVYNQATIDGYIEAKLERLKRKIKNI
jgi:NTP pyrophosphatase (non-canonical NTP hydrolase)